MSMPLPTVPQGVSLKPMSHPGQPLVHSIRAVLRRALSPLLITGCFTSALITANPGQSAEVVLYKLETQCSLAGAAAINCMVEAVDEGKSTLYRHQIGQRMETVRITDDPVSMTLWKADSKQWQHLRNASGRFSTNTVCFNDQDLCVVNPNYLNSVRQDSPAKMAGRDLVRVHFAGDGRIDATCFDAGCDVVKR